MKNPVKVTILHSLSRSQKGHQVAAMIRSLPIIWLLQSLAKPCQRHIQLYSGPVVEKISPHWPKSTTNLISANFLASELWFHKLLLSWCHCLSARSTLVSAVRETQAKTMTKPDICQVWGTTALFRLLKGAPKSAQIRDKLAKNGQNLALLMLKVVRLEKSTPPLVAWAQ